MAWNTPTAINNRSQVVGFVNLPDTKAGAFNPVAFLWTQEGGIQKLLPFGEDTNDWAWGINAQGQVVGQSFGASSARAFLYQGGVMTDLNTLIQPGSSLYLVLANDINDSGEIVGYATDTNSNATVAFLAVPVYGGNGDAANAEGNSRTMIVPDSVRRQMPGFGRFLGSK